MAFFTACVSAQSGNISGISCLNIRVQLGTALTMA